MARELNMGYLNFIDDWFLSYHSNFVRKLGKPEFIKEATLEDDLCEGTWDFPCVAYLENEQKYIGLYVAAISIPGYVPPCVFTEEDALRGFYLTPKRGVLCYCESKDGIHWEKPDFTDKIKLNDRRLKNQVTDGFEGAPVFYDKWTKDENTRFKAVYCYISNGDDGHNKGASCRGIMASNDGINWKHFKSYWNIPASDSPSTLSYDEDTETYYIYARRYNGDRRIFAWKSKDLENFEEMGFVMHPDPMDASRVGFYGMPVFKYENLFYGLLWRIHNHPQYKGLAGGPIDIGLTYSYDGSHFNRAFYDAFIPRNPLGEHGCGCIYSSSMFVDKDNNIRIYSGGSKAEHFQNQNLTDAAIMLHKLRLDGFMYLESLSRTAILRTKELRFHGEELKINAKCPFGMARVQILDEEGHPIEGFTFDDCTPLKGDELFWQPEFKGGSIKNIINGRKRRQVEIEITSGQLFAIRGDFELLKSHHDSDN